MAQDFLSQDEVDALLKGVQGEIEEPDEELSGEAKIRAYNIGTQERIVRGRMPTLELINERFARYLRIGLFNFMHRNADVSVGPIKVQKYGEFIRNLVVPTNLNLVQMKPLRGMGLVVFDPDLVFLMVDNLFGGDGRFHARIEGRDFTATEQRIILGLLKVVFAEYERSWKPVFGVKFDYIRSEINSQFANIATPNEIVVSFHFTLEFGGTSGNMHFCFPYSMIEPIRGIIYSTIQGESTGEDKRWISTMRRQIRDLDVKLTAKLAEREITLGEILKMKVGDVLHVDIGKTIHAEIGGVPIMECTYGQRSQQYALKIEKFIPPELEDELTSLTEEEIAGYTEEDEDTDKDKNHG